MTSTGPRTSRIFADGRDGVEIRDQGQGQGAVGMLNSALLQAQSADTGHMAHHYDGLLCDYPYAYQHLLLVPCFEQSTDRVLGQPESGSTNHSRLGRSVQCPTRQC